LVIEIDLVGRSQDSHFLHLLTSVQVYLAYIPSENLTPSSYRNLVLYPAEVNIGELPLCKALVSRTNLTGTPCYTYMLPKPSLTSLRRHVLFTPKFPRERTVKATELFCPRVRSVLSLPRFNNLMPLLLHRIRCETIAPLLRRYLSHRSRTRASPLYLHHQAGKDVGTPRDEDQWMARFERGSDDITDWHSGTAIYTIASSLLRTLLTLLSRNQSKRCAIEG